MRVTLLLLISLLLSSWSYEVAKNHSVPDNPNVQNKTNDEAKIVKKMDLYGLDVKYLGTIKVDHAGLANCPEDKVIIMLKSEAQKLHSNLINITDEDYFSCYRGIANFYSVNNEQTNRIIGKAHRSELKYDSINKLKWDYFNISKDTMRIPYRFVSSIEVKSTGPKLFTGNYKEFKAQGVFYYDISTVSASIVNDSTLQHIQLLYDLSQIYAKKLEKYLNSIKIKMNDKSTIEEAIMKFVKDLHAEQHTYMNETDYGRNTQIQSEWSFKIKSEVTEQNK